MARKGEPTTFEEARAALAHLTAEYLDHKSVCAACQVNYACAAVASFLYPIKRVATIMDELKGTDGGTQG